MSVNKHFWKLFPALFCLSLIALLLVPDALYALDDDVCKAADEKVAEGELEDAEELYNEIIAADDTSQCALQGLKEVAEIKCVFAEKPEEAGDLEGTNTAILTEYHTKVCVAATEYDKVQALRMAGMDDKAWEHLEEAIKEDPDDDQLNGLAGESWARFQAGRTWVTEYLFPFAKFAIGAIIALVLVFLLGGFITSRSSLKLDLEAFSLGALKLEPDPSTELVSRVETALVRIGKVSKSHRPGLIAEPLAPASFPASVTVAKEVGQLWDFFISLWPPNRIVLSAVLVYEKAKGAGLMLKLVEKKSNKILEQQTIWQDHLMPDYAAGDAAKAKDFNKLADAAAIWTYWQFYQMKYKNIGERNKALRNSFGTDSWQSYIGNYFGAQLLNGRKMSDAKRMLHFALAFDNKNCSALFNLAMVNIEADEPDFDEAVQYLNKVKTIDAPPAADACQLDLVSLFADYQLAAIETYKFIDNKPAKMKKAQKKLKSALAVVKALLKNCDKDRPGIVELKETLQIAVSYVKVLRGAQYPHDKIVKIEKQVPFDGAVVYNLACYYAAAANKGQPKDAAIFKQEDAIARALQYVEKALIFNPDYYSEWAPKDESLANLWENDAFKKLIQATKSVIPNLTFPLKDVDKIKSELKDLKRGDRKVTAVVVVTEEHSETKLVTQKAHSYDGLTLIDFCDKNGQVIQPPYNSAKIIHIGLPLSTKDTATNFAAHVECATAIYLIPGEETASFEIYCRGGKYRFRLVTGDGTKILKSKGRPTLDDCQNGIKSVKSNAPLGERYRRKKASNGKYHFKLAAKTGKTIGSSPKKYKEEETRDATIERVKKTAPTAPTKFLL